eukprot:5065484-Amphidinium_carterae.2
MRLAICRMIPYLTQQAIWRCTSRSGQADCHAMPKEKDELCAVKKLLGGTNPIKTTSLQIVHSGNVQWNEPIDLELVAQHSAAIDAACIQSGLLVAAFATNGRGYLNACQCQSACVDIDCKVVGASEKASVRKEYLISPDREHGK